MNLSIGVGSLYWGGSYFLAGFVLSVIIVVLALCLTNGRTAFQKPLSTHQIFSIYGDGLICANSTSIIPESYDLMMKMGQGATAILVRSMEHRFPVCAWKPVTALSLLVSSVSIVTFGCLSFHGLDKTASLDDIIMWLFALRGIMSFFNGMYLMQSLVALWSTPKVEMVAFNKSNMGIRTLGLGVGPLFQIWIHPAHTRSIGSCGSDFVLDGRALCWHPFPLSVVDTQGSSGDGGRQDCNGRKSCLPWWTMRLAMRQMSWQLKSFRSRSAIRCLYCL